MYPPSAHSGWRKKNIVLFNTLNESVAKHEHQRQQIPVSPSGQQPELVRSYKSRADSFSLQIETKLCLQWDAPPLLPVRVIRGSLLWSCLLRHQWEPSMRGGRVIQNHSGQQQACCVRGCGCSDRLLPLRCERASANPSLLLKDWKWSLLTLKTIFWWNEVFLFFFFIYNGSVFLE